MPTLIPDGRDFYGWYDQHGNRYWIGCPRDYARILARLRLQWLLDMRSRPVHA